MMSEAKHLKMRRLRILRPFAVCAAQGDVSPLKEKGPATQRVPSFQSLTINSRLFDLRQASAALSFVQQSLFSSAWCSAFRNAGASSVRKESPTFRTSA